MLKPYVCVACEKVIIEQPLEGVPGPVGGVASLISLFNKITAVVAVEIPPNSVAPKEWAIFSSWDSDPEDAGRYFEICTQILYPNKSPFHEIARQKLNVEANKRSQHVVKLSGFPIGQAGFYTVKTWIEENGSRVIDPIEFRIEVDLQKKE